MYYYIDNRETCPYYNLALEQTLFDRLDRTGSYCMLWQNDKSVIVGKHQNTAAEICVPFTEKNGISVVRRLSGGGAVYHDLGNINFTFITGICGGNINFKEFCSPILEALLSFSIPVEFSGRNDIMIDGKKISGNAQYLSHDRVMHHGTLLYDTDLAVLEKSLAADGRIQSKGIKSVRNRVANIRPFMKNDMPPENFRTFLKDFLFSALKMNEYKLSTAEITAAENLRDTVYSQWNWNYGSSPPYNLRKNRRFENCGTVEIYLEVGKNGIIKAVNFYGDFFYTDDPDGLTQLLCGHHFEKNELSVVLNGIDISRYFHNLGNELFLSLLLD